jgi:hypothetical protein
MSLGVVLSITGLPRDFDIGGSMISRLSSRVHNPAGHGYLTLGLLGLAALLAPVPYWLARNLTGCTRLRAWGRTIMLLGLVATAFVGIERAVFPTHETRYEQLHLVYAGLAFTGLWLGMAMFAGAIDNPGGVRIRWRWLWRPPWYLSVSMFPLLALLAMFVSLHAIPGVRTRILTNWPSQLVFMRTATFWQWYLVIGLALSLVLLTRRACLAASQARVGLSVRGWRFDRASGIGNPNSATRLRRAGGVG